MQGSVRPRAELVQRARSGQSRQAAPKVAVRVRVIGRVSLVRAGHRAGRLVDGELVEGEPAVHGRAQRPRLDDRGVPGLRPGRGQQLAGAVGRIAQHLDRVGFLGQQLDADRGVGVLRPGGRGQRAAGDDPGVRLDLHVRLVAVLVAGAGLVRVPGLGINGGDHPLRGHLPGDPPAPVGAVRALGRFHVLAGHQRQQRHRLRGLRRRARRRAGARAAGAHPRPARRPAAPGRRDRPRRSPACPARGSRGPSSARRSPRRRRARRGRPGGSPAISWVTVSWVATASSSTVESSARRVFPASTPVSATTCRTTSKIRFGRADRASRRRQ